MQKLRIVFLFLFVFIIKTSFAQDDPVVIAYINTYRDIAISEMQRTGVPAAIKLAQGIHETEAGSSMLVKKSNNHFGIKCKTEWTGETVSHTDDAPNECFRKYNSAIDSYKDHSDFLKNSARYAQLFNLDPTDYKSWAWGLKKAGYATNTRYPQIIIKLIEDYHLEDYTLIALGKMKPSDAYFVKQEMKQDDQTAEAKFIETKTEVSAKEPDPSTVLYKEEKGEPQTIYPDGEFKINETRVIYASKGTSYLSIAEKYNLPLARVFEFNDMKEQEVVDKDQLIYIMRKRKTGNNEQHIVKTGETLFDIAQVQAIRMESLLEYNNLKPGMKPAAGTVLYLRGKAPVSIGSISESR
ncbi:MAG: LysM peptidoglycan-binding domain-containing protein [Chitinophagaceae bacterium]|nr:MAG: LysM peptidoglycan-binding domain-containing protein [Chitinophagaceae bacterium]